MGRARERCWKFNWVLDLDVQAFFDTLDHALVMRAVKRYTDCRWVLLYVERWLKAPLQLQDGTLELRTSGTPQGGVISPLLANIFLHLAFDQWMQNRHPEVPFERYADDVIVHCRTEAQAKVLQRSIEARLARCRLRVHPQKTRIAYCKDSNRLESHSVQSFDFLGFTFRPRLARNRRGVFFVSFSPAVSRRAATALRQRAATIVRCPAPNRHRFGWLGSAAEPDAARLDQVLRRVPAVSVARNPAIGGPLARPLGDAKVQAVQESTLESG